MDAKTLAIFGHDRRPVQMSENGEHGMVWRAIFSWTSCRSTNEALDEIL
jgi:hypothetical protein